MRLRQEKIERGRDIGLQVLAMNDGVEEPVLQKKFRRLKTFGKFLADGLFNDARPGKTDERAGLGDVDVTQHGIARGDAAGRGIGEDGNKRQADLIEPRERSEEHTSELQSHLNLVCRL